MGREDGTEEGGLMKMGEENDVEVKLHILHKTMNNKCTNMAADARRSIFCMVHKQLGE